jgi:UDP-glucose 4-epimerase
MEYQKNKVFVTGGAGFIGSYIAKQLLEQGDEVVVYDAFIQYSNPLENINYQRYLQSRFKGFHNQITFLRGDTRDKHFLREKLLEYKPTHIIHLAALPISDLGDQNPEEAIQSIIQGAVNVLDSIKDMEGIKRFVYASSSMVYGDFEYAPADEEHPKRPKGIYGGAKLAGEILTESYGRRYGIPYAIVRPSAVYGPGDVNRRVSQIFLENALQGKILKLHNGGQSKLDFSWVEDTARGFILVALHPNGENQIFNITRGEGRSLKELADIVSSVCDRKVTIEMAPADIHRPERGALDIQKARDLLGYNPTHSLEEGMKKFYDFTKPFYEDDSHV